MRPQAWKAVDRAYVDKSFNGNTWFRVKEQFLKNEPMTDRDETYAAIRKMLALLNDPFTRLLDPTQYAVLKRGSSGSVTGVGLEVAFSQAPETQGQLLVRQRPMVLRVHVMSCHVMSYHALSVINDAGATVATQLLGSAWC